MNASTTYRQPNLEELRKHLPEVGEGLQAQLSELHARPSADKAEQLAANLYGARTHVLRLAEAIRRESEHGNGGQ